MTDLQILVVLAVCAIVAAGSLTAIDRIAR